MIVPPVTCASCSLNWPALCCAAEAEDGLSNHHGCRQRMHGCVGYTFVTSAACSHIESRCMSVAVSSELTIFLVNLVRKLIAMMIELAMALMVV